MELKKTKLLVAELRVMALTQENEYCKEILNEAAERLEVTDKIAEFFRKEATKRTKKKRVDRILKEVDKFAEFSEDFWCCVVPYNDLKRILEDNLEGN